MNRKCKTQRVSLLCIFLNCFFALTTAFLGNSSRASSFGVTKKLKPKFSFAPKSLIPSSSAEKPNNSFEKPTTSTKMLTDGSLIDAAVTAYTSCLDQYPMATKSVTASVLCGLSDYIAQVRSDPYRFTYRSSKINWQRLGRFALKGCANGVLWAYWYDTADAWSEDVIRSCRGLVGTDMATSPIAKAVVSILLEQFVWCPINFGTWEIPVSTILNGASPKTIPNEVQSKLGDLLVSNAKVWTVANMLIYSAPLEYRAGLGNLVDIFWQSIVSDVAAGCGTGTVATETAQQEEVILPNVVLTEPDPQRV